MPPLILPKSQMKKNRDEAAAASISSSAINNMASDDFVTLSQVRDQLEDLKDYMEARREQEPEYVLPAPAGWRILVLMLTIPETTEGGLVMVGEHREARAMASPQGVVLAVGRAAYQDPSRFAFSGEIDPWCKPGDRVMWRRYDVTTFQLGNGQRLGLLNDTQPVGVIDGDWEIPK